ncbi:hypothetical protein CALVIDRAFT_599536 [Calocera viscosa TUFC12733]|uniref:Methyltransferase type 11 domain-containing protein n=1 Tax=Calocera viscosa (strain TUFC12733) TaxID=1330018 RepID=A0A167KWR6_CALVF|nr:hypothetical protein CALVIDRAFT_599536 [Calocera viscosa TUFC12733]
MSGNLSHSMRENYDTHGVEKYYGLVSASYRNPHFPGVQKCLHAWLDKWWLRESGQRGSKDAVSFWDLAAGSGEVTEAILNWYSVRRSRSENDATPAAVHANALFLPVRKPSRRSDVTLDPSTPMPLILASDPFTAPAYTARTSRQCARLSFADVAEGNVPSAVEENPSEVALGDTAADHDQNLPSGPEVIDMVVSSFALHLCTPSELFALLYELSTKSNWLVVIAPHKKPEIKPGWGWVRWNVVKWEVADSDHETEAEVEIVLDRVRLRVWKSLNT